MKIVIGLYLRIKAMRPNTLIHTLKRFQTLFTHRITVLPIAIIMPHSACNCKCVMCDIWKGNKNSKQLEEEDIRSLLISLGKLQTKRVLMSGGEALLNKNFFRFCEILTKNGIKITLLSTGLTLARHAENIITHVDEVIVSLDGDEPLHDEIRNIKGAYAELKNGVRTLKDLQPDFKIKARTVIHRYNYKQWRNIILSARDFGLDGISFLPADVSSEAFNRPQAWEKSKQNSVLIARDDLPELQTIVDGLIHEFVDLFESRYIAESPTKINKIVQYYAAHHGLNSFPHKACNAPWVSAVIEADGTVRPCFFLEAQGNIRNEALDVILNKPNHVLYRNKLDTNTHPTCMKCVCSLNLSPRNSNF
ncbi:MAG: radical SAM protein [bacterium]|nr:radical SAM protein [bacterium]